MFGPDRELLRPRDRCLVASRAASLFSAQLARVSPRFAQEYRILYAVFAGKSGEL
jgi:hypothetical protein